MSLKSEVLESMPIGVEMLTPEIAYKIRPEDTEYQHRMTTTRVYNALSLLAKWGDVELVGQTNAGQNKSVVNKWIRRR